MWIKRQVVTLPTNEKAPLMIGEKPDGLIYSKNYGFDLFNHNNNFRHINKQHLYFLRPIKSEQNPDGEEIKEGDFIFSISAKPQINKATLENSFDVKNMPDGYKKIIATTDSSLMCIKGQMKNGSYLPQPSQEFIKVFVEEYNKKVANGIYNGHIELCVEVEYEPANIAQEIIQIGVGDEFVTQWKLKVNSNNEINIRLVEQKSITHDVVQYAMEVVSKDVRSPKVVRDGLVKSTKKMYSKDEVIKIAMDCMMYGYNGLPKNLTPIQGMNKWIDENL